MDNENNGNDGGSLGPGNSPSVGFGGSTLKRGGQGLELPWKVSIPKKAGSRTFKEDAGEEAAKGGCLADERKASSTSTKQPCDTGKCHMLTRDFAIASTKIDEPLATALQSLQDKGGLIMSAAKLQHITNSIIRLSGVLCKSYNEKSIIRAFTLSGTTQTTAPSFKVRA